ncbi:hypothetical protein AAH991_26510 [Microbispora sp. ZYX-F-249]|uniref:Uncharacterized protein n=1 Tax=Microbispora maris TaxID=3144104 RepID=A0ABV0AWL8_9ACTN
MANTLTEAVGNFIATINKKENFSIYSLIILAEELLELFTEAIIKTPN